ncbi:MAG: DUF1467 family protein [Hyphomicrobiales bacterium]|nr:DUF1467 family protein [Hyphomicrobiales bacterium]
MSLPTALAIYFLIWWVVLFTVLPFGIRSQHESGELPEGTDPGAPVAAQLVLRLLWTTVISAVVFAVLAVVYTRRWITLEDLLVWLDLPR